MIVQIVLIIPVVSNDVKKIGTIIWKHYPMIANDLDDWDGLGYLDRVEFYPDNRGDHVNFEAIIRKKL